MHVNRRDCEISGEAIRIGAFETKTSPTTTTTTTTPPFLLFLLLALYVPRLDRDKGDGAAALDPTMHEFLTFLHTLTERNKITDNIVKINNLPDGESGRR